MSADRDKLNQRAFQRFDDFLNLRRKEVTGEDGTDIRAHVLSLRDAPWVAGYAAFNLETAYAANMRLFWSDLRAFDDPGALPDNRLLMGTVYADAAKSHQGAVEILQEQGAAHRLLMGEQGFLASTHSWSQAFRARDPAMGCLGYVYDDIAHYFMSDYPNRLIHRLNSDQVPEPRALERARGLIRRIVSQRISKYNSQPIHPPTMSRGYSRRVLVCDQSFADASTVFGRIDEAGFERMLVAALTENPDAEVLVKTHPDTAWEPEKRSGYYSHLESVGRVRILREPLNPYCLFEMVDTVYVGTSQLGLEALFAGKRVVTFGAPFYAGWGLTDDRQEIPHRHRTRSLEEIFHYFYVWYTIYHVPGDVAAPSEIETVLDFIEANRPAALPAPRPEPPAPKVSVIIPVYGVERYIEACLASVQAQSLHEIEMITINDRSPDGSQAIIDRMAAEDPRIRPIVLPQNVGQGFARNAGLEAALGDYVWFLDSDDFLVSPDHLRLALDCARADRADMVRGRKLFEQVEDEEGNVLRMERDRSEIHFDTPFHAARIDTEPRILRSRHFCNWLYRRAFLEENGVRFLTAQWEERPFLWRALLSAERISGTTTEAFTYRIRRDSTARRAKSVRDSFNQLANLEQMAEILKEFDAFAPGSRFAHAAGYAVTQALHILFCGFAYATVRAAEEPGLRRRFLDRVADTLDAAGLEYDDLVFEAPQISRQRIGTQSYRLLFEALRARRYEHVDTAVDQVPLPQETVMAEILETPADARAAAFQVALSLFARNDRVITAETFEPVAEKPRLVIHVGQTKTGTTYLQHFLERNRPALLRGGVLVPDKGLFWQSTRPEKQAGHSEVTREAVTGGQEIRDHIEAALALAGGRVHTVIISSEAYFLNRRAALIPDHFPGYRAEMIGYFRRQDDWANSQYAEFVAGGAVGRVAQDFAAWLDDPITRERFDYHDFCRLWAARVGRERVHARPYDRDRLAGGDVVSDFLATLGLEAFDALPRPSARAGNEMPFNAAHVALLRDINAYAWPDREAYLDFVAEVTDRLSLLGPAQRRALQIITPSERRRLMTGLADSNTAFVRAFCPDGAAVFAPDGPCGAMRAAAGTASTEETPADDVATEAEIRAIFDALSAYDPGRRMAEAERAARRRPPTPARTRDEVLSLQGLFVDVAGLPETVAPGAALELDVAVYNLSRLSLPERVGRMPVHLSYHIFDARGRKVVWNGVRTDPCGPIESRTHRARLAVAAPAKPGRYRLQPAVVVEGVRWFDSSRSVDFEVA